MKNNNSKTTEQTIGLALQAFADKFEAALRAEVKGRRNLTVDSVNEVVGKVKNATLISELISITGGLNQPNTKRKYTRRATPKTSAAKVTTTTLEVEEVAGGVQKGETNEG